MISGSGVCGSRVSLGIAVVGDISDVTGITINFVVNVLLATVGKCDPVVSLGVMVTIAGLLLAHVYVSVVVVDGPVEFVVPWYSHSCDVNDIKSRSPICQNSSIILSPKHYKHMCHITWK